MSLKLVSFEFNCLTDKAELNLLNELDELARVWDDDFSGKNGEDYLWEDARDGGYECNADYVYEDIKERIETGDYDSFTVDSIRYATIVEDYLDMWLGGDNYYGEYNYCQPAEGCFAIAWNSGAYL